MEIPSEFDLMGHTIEVKQVKVPAGIKSEIESYGTWSKDKLLITLHDWGQPHSLKLHTYFHEILHAALDFVGKEDLSKDEGFVDTLAGVICQALTTGRE